MGTNPATLFAGRVADADSIKQVEVKLGLDKPILVQYGHYLQGIVVGRHFDGGTDQTYCPATVPRLLVQERPGCLAAAARPVAGDVVDGQRRRGAVAGLRGAHRHPVGSATRKPVRPGRHDGRPGRGLAPVYFTGLLALSLFSYQFKLLPNVHYVGFTDNTIQWARNLLLPWICLAFLYAATYARLTRADMLETMGEDYIRTARAKGLPERPVIGKHGLRAALTPIVTIFGLDLGGLLGGAVLTERVFGLPGVGKLAVDAIGASDLPIILGVTLFAAFFIIVANLIVDVLYAFVDPR